MVAQESAVKSKRNDPGEPFCDWFVDGDSVSVHLTREKLRELITTLQDIETARPPYAKHLLVGDGEEARAADSGPTDGQPLRRVSVYLWH